MSQNATYATLSLSERLAPNPYPGRGIVLGLTPDGIVGPATWTALYDRASAIASQTRNIVGQYPGSPLRVGDSDYQEVRR